MRARPAGGIIRIVDARIKLDGDPPAIARLRQRNEHRLEVDRAGSWHHVVVNTGGGDILQVHMPDMGRQHRDHQGGILPHAVAVADVKIEAQPWRAEPSHELHGLLGSFNQQARLWFNQQLDPLAFGVLENRLDLLDEQVKRTGPRRPRLDRTTRLGGDAWGAQFPGKGQRPFRMVDPNEPIIAVRLNPTGVPVLLPRIVDRVRELSRVIQEMSQSEDTMDFIEDRRAEVERQISIHARRSRLIQNSLTSFYFSLSLFVGATVAVGFILTFPRALHRVLWIPNIFGIVGTVILFYGCVLLIAETRLALRSVNSEMEFTLRLREKYKQRRALVESETRREIAHL